MLRAGEWRLVADDFSCWRRLLATSLDELSGWLGFQQEQRWSQAPILGRYASAQSIPKCWTQRSLPLWQWQQIQEMLPRQARRRRVLAEMTRRAFCAGFAWSVIEAKWPGFEQAFLNFEPGRCRCSPTSSGTRLMKDTRIVRNGAKIMSVRDNAGFVSEVAQEHGSFGKLLAKWPASDEIGLLELLAKARQPARRQYRPDVAALPRLGRLCDLEGRGRVPARCRPRHRRDRHLEARPCQGAGAVQRLGRGNRPALQHLSRICAMSIGENYGTETLARMAGGEE